MARDVRILILAAGTSSRMRGRDKLLEIVEGAPLLSRQVRMAQATGWPVAVALPPAPHPRHALIGGVEAIEVPDAAEGMGASLAAGFTCLEAAHAILVLLADLPEIGTADLRAVIEAGDGFDGIVRGATAEGRPGHPLLVPRPAFPHFRALRGDDGGRAAVARHPVRLVPLPGERARRDLDTPEDWAAWRAARA